MLFCCDYYYLLLGNDGSDYFCIDNNIIVCTTVDVLLIFVAIHGVISGTRSSNLGEAHI